MTTSPSGELPTRPLAHRIITQHLVIRAYAPDDLTALHRLVLANIEHLRTFIPWAAHEPRSLDERKALLSDYTRSFAAGENFRYAIIDAATGEMAGGVSLHTRVGPDALEVGYWLGAGFEGRGIASEAVTAASHAALDAGATKVEIWCTPENARSAAVAHRCGFTYAGERLRDGLALSVWILEP